LQFVISLLIIFLLSSTCFAEDFPYRKNYPDVPIIELGDARSSYEKGEAIFVDARTKMEFDTIHTKGAIHIDFGNQNFLSDLLQIGKDNPGGKIIVYDNGITCLKCYIGVQDATDEEMKNVYAYDGGIQAWAEAYPSDTILYNSDGATNERLQNTTHTI
jgi:rhodanese-related sulfurtransferase